MLDHTKAEYEDMVSGPGKFEGCEAWVAAVWERTLDGCWEDVGGWEGIAGGTLPENTQYGHITAAEDQDLVDMFPELDGMHVYVWEDDNGFVYGALEEERAHSDAADH